METAPDPGKVILDEITALQVQRARIEARIASKMLDFQDQRRSEADTRENETARRLEVSFAADELGVTVHQPTRTVQCRLAEAKRSVWVDHQDDGMSFLHAYLPTTDAIRIDRQLTDRAKALPADDRTLDQKRADELAAQMLSTGQGPVRSRAAIGITVPLTSLAGLDDEPGESFDGSFALPAQAVRDLAKEPGTLFHRVLTDPLGKILDITELGRFASDKLSTAIDIRDGTCRFTTCNRPAIESDLDHQIPHPRGLNRPGMSGELIRWKDHSHGTSLEVPVRAA